MSVLGNFMKWEPLRSKDFSTITGSYTAVGAATTHPINLFKIVNNTDAVLLYSFDAVTDQIVVPAGASLVIDINANKSQIRHLLMGANQTLYVRYESAAPTERKTYLATMYGGTLVDQAD